MTITQTILLSVFGHGILLMSWPHVASFSVSSTTPSYQITLLEKATQEKITEQAPHQLKRTEYKKTNSTHNSQSKPISKELKSSKENETSNLKAYVISRINHKIRKNFKYPKLAQRNGWEGKVLLSLILNPEGKIENAHIKYGSGYGVLDQAALNALLKVKNIQKTNYRFNFNLQEIIIPVIYRLHKG